MAPHGAPVGHVAEQQWPEPDTPQIALEHCLFAVHAAPAAPFATHADVFTLL